MKWFDNTALTLVIIGAVNWLLVGIFRFDLVAFLFGNLTWLSRFSPWSKISKTKKRGINVIIPSFYALFYFYERFGI